MMYTSTPYMSTNIVCKPFSLKKRNLLFSFSSRDESGNRHRGTKQERGGTEIAVKDNAVQFPHPRKVGINTEELRRSVEQQR